MTFSYLSNCQNYKLTYEIVEYKNFEKQISQNFTTDQKNMIAKMYSDLKNDGKNLKLEIIANDNGYYWKMNSGLKKEYINHSQLSSYFMFGIFKNAFQQNGTTYFYNNNDRFITRANTDELLNWNINTNQTAKIRNQSCQVFLGQNISDYNLGFKAIKLKAYVNLELPIKGGPTIFGNLPGLIIALENKFVKFELTSIKETQDTMIALEDFLNNKVVYSFEKAEEYHNKVSEEIINNY